MKIVIANTDSMVSKLIEACAKKTGLQVQHFISLEEIDASMLEDCFLFVDENALGSDTKRAKQIGTDSLSCLIYSRRKPLNEFKYLVQKPFLPTQVLELIRKELVRRGEDFNRAVEEEKKAPIEPIKDIPLNEFDLKDEHIFEGNLELPPLPDTNEVDTKTSAQSAKEQKEQDELQSDEENFLDVGENIAHKSLAALDREKSGESSEVSADNASGADESLAGDMGESSQAVASDEASLDSINSTEFASESASDIRESLAGDLDDSLASIDSLGSLDNLDNLGDGLDNEANNTADSGLDDLSVENSENLASLDKLDDIASLNPIKGNLAGLGASDSSDLSGLANIGEASEKDSEAISSSASEKDELLSGDDFANDLGDELSDDLHNDLGSDLESADLAGGENLGQDIADTSNETTNTNEDLANIASDDVAQNTDEATNEIQEQTLTQEAQESLEITSQGIDENVASENASTTQEGATSAENTVNDIESDTESIEGESTDSASADSAPAFESGVLDKDEAQTIQELLNGDAKEVENVTNNEATSENVANETSEGKSDEIESAQAEDFADLSENDIMEVLGEESPNTNAESSEQESSQITPQTESNNTQSSDSTNSEIAQEVAQESTNKITQESAQIDSAKPIAEQSSATQEVAQEHSADLAQQDLPSDLQGDLQNDVAKSESLESLAQEQTNEASNALNDDKLDSIMPDNIDDLASLSSELDKQELDNQTQDKPSELDSSLQEEIEQNHLDEIDLAEGVPSNLSLEDNELPDSLQSVESLSGENEGVEALEADNNVDSNESLEQNIAEEMPLDSLSQAQPLAQEAQPSDTNEATLDSLDSLDSSIEANADSSNLDLSNIPESGVSKYLEVSDTANEEANQDLENELQEADISDTEVQTNALAQSSQNPNEPTISSVAKSTQKRLITELLANKSVEEIGSLLEGAHIRIDIDFSQK